MRKHNRKSAIGVAGILLGTLSISTGVALADTGDKATTPENPLQLSSVITENKVTPVDNKQSTEVKSKTLKEGAESKKENKNKDTTESEVDSKKENALKAGEKDSVNGTGGDDKPSVTGINGLLEKDVLKKTLKPLVVSNLKVNASDSFSCEAVKTETVRETVYTNGTPWMNFYHSDGDFSATLFKGVCESNGIGTQNCKTSVNANMAFANTITVKPGGYITKVEVPVTDESVPSIVSTSGVKCGTSRVGDSFVGICRTADKVNQVKVTKDGKICQANVNTVDNGVFEPVEYKYIIKDAITGTVIETEKATVSKMGVNSYHRNYRTVINRPVKSVEGGTPNAAGLIWRKINVESVFPTEKFGQVFVNSTTNYTGTVQWIPVESDDSDNGSEVKNPDPSPSDTANPVPTKTSEPVDTTKPTETPKPSTSPSQSVIPVKPTQVPTVKPGDTYTPTFPYPIVVPDGNDGVKDFGDKKNDEGKKAKNSEPTLTPIPKDTTKAPVVTPSSSTNKENPDTQKAASKDPEKRVVAPKKVVTPKAVRAEQVKSEAKKTDSLAKTGVAVGGLSMLGLGLIGGGIVMLSRRNRKVRPNNR